MPVPTYQELMLPLLRLADSARDLWTRQAVQDLANELQLTDEDRAQLIPSGQESLFSNRFHWAKTYMIKAGVLEPVRRGCFRITDRGRELLATSPQRIDNKVLGQYAEFQDFMASRNRDAANERGTDSTNSSSLDIATSDNTPLEIIRAAQAQLDDALTDELITRILAMPPDFLERLVVNLVVAMGYGSSALEAGKAIGRSGDNGVDGVIHQDALGLDRVYIQAKRYNRHNLVGGPEIRDFYGSLTIHKAAKGVFVTTSDFTPQAKKNAESLPHRIVLFDGRHLAALMIRYNIGCRTEETVLLKRIDEGFFE
jgi:restriction system protein